MTDPQDLGANLVEEIRRGMVYDDACRDLENGFEYWIGGHRQTVTSEGPIEQNGMTGWLVTARTDFLRAKDPERGGNVSSLGRLAKKLCFCGVAEGEEPGTWQLVSSVLVHEGIASWIMRPLFQGCTHQFVHCFEWPEPMTELEPYFEPLKTNAPGEEDPSLVDAMREQVDALIEQADHGDTAFIGEELLAVTASLQGPPCVLCNGSEKGMTAEFPFDEWTQMLTVIEKYHESLGRGIEVLLRLPFGENPDGCGKMVMRLNDSDASSHQSGHLLGSWCTDETHGVTLAHQQFIPYAYLKPNLLTNYIYGFMTRARWVDGVLNDSDWSDSYESVQQNKIDSFEQTSATILDDPEEAMETKDKIYEDVDAADAIFRKLSDFLGVLEDPIEVKADFFKAVGQFSLFHYGIFNPMGPTWNVFSVARHPKHEALLFCNRMLNPFDQSNHVLGAYLEESPKGTFDMVLDMFGRNGSSETPLLGGMPTWVFVPEGADEQLAEEAFRSYYEEQGGEGLDRQVANLRKFEGNPWDRASEEMKGAMQEAMAGLKKESFVKKIFKSKKKPPEATFEDWWEIVSSEEHLQSEIYNMTPAWNGSIEMQKSHGTSGSFPNLMDFEGLIKAWIEPARLRKSSAVSSREKNN